MKKLALLLASLALTLLVGGCGGQGSSADYPADFKVVAGDAAVTVTWTADPEVEYWIFYGPGTGITTTNWVAAGGGVAAKVASPHVISGLTNDKVYSFTINGRRNGGPGGSGAPTQVATPHLAGGAWGVGAPLGTARLNGLAIGSVATGSAAVTVGAGGTIFASINGAATTTPANPSAPADLNAICYATTGFIAAGAGGTVLLSTDAATWATQATGVTTALNGCTSIGTGAYVVVGAAGTIITSGTGTTWVTGTSGTTNDLYGTAYGNGVFVIVGANGTILSSTDAATWTAVTTGTTAALRGVAYGALSSTAADGTITITNAYVAVGANGTVLRSTNGTTWTALAPIAATDITAVTYGGQFVAVGKGGGIFTSPDGITWTARTSGTTSDLAAVARTLSGYTAVGDAGTNVSSL